MAKAVCALTLALESLRSQEAIPRHLTANRQWPCGGARVLTDADLNDYFLWADVVLMESCNE